MSDHVCTPEERRALHIAIGSAAELDAFLEEARWMVRDVVARAAMRSARAGLSRDPPTSLTEAERVTWCDAYDQARAALAKGQST